MLFMAKCVQREKCFKTMYIFTFYKNNCFNFRMTSQYDNCKVFNNILSTSFHILSYIKLLCNHIFSQLQLLVLLILFIWVSVRDIKSVCSSLGNIGTYLFPLKIHYEQIYSKIEYTVEILNVCPKSTELLTGFAQDRKVYTFFLFVCYAALRLSFMDPSFDVLNHKNVGDGGDIIYFSCAPNEH